MSNDDRDTPPNGRNIEWLTKAAALVAGLSLAVGIVYNVSFFSVSGKPHWIFYLTVADNLAAALFALPFVMLALVLIGLRWLAPPPLSLISDLLNALGSLVLVVAAAYFLSAKIDAVFVGMVGGAIFFSVLSICSTLSRYVRLPPSSATFVDPAMFSLAVAAIVPCLMAGVLAAVLTWAMLAISPTHVRIELPDKLVLSGSLVRLLDGGAILAEGKGWIWVPKAEIKRLTELPSSEVRKS